MVKAMGSRINLFSDELTAVEYYNCIEDLIEQPMVQRLDEFDQHCGTSRLQHCINVSYYSFLICRYFGLDYRSAARGGLLHDLFLYDWREKGHMTPKKHAFWHPIVALDNARKITELNKKEKDIIIKHMWPVTIRPPRYLETLIVTFVDKYSAVLEFVIQKTVAPDRSQIGANFHQKKQL